MTALSRFVEPPRLRTAAGEDVDDRRATWLELFFDLVFVAAVGQLSNALAAHPTFPRFLGFVALFVPVWWLWMGFTFYANRFDTDDLPYRLLTLLAMFLVAVLSTTVRGVFHGSSTGFALAYLCARVILLVLYERARRHVPEARRLATIFLAAFGVATGFWIVSLALPAPSRYVLWGIALALELAAPLFAWRQLPQAPIHPRHIPERFGLLTLIVLGESVLGVVLGIAHVPWGAASAATAAGGFAAAAALWWIYFEFLDETTIGARGLVGGLTYTYMHFPIVVGLAALGAGVKLAILSAGGEARYDDTSWILCAGLALTMVGLAAIQLVRPPVLFDTDVRLRLATAVVALGLIPFGPSPLLVTLVLAGLLAAQVVYELAEHEGHVAKQDSSPRYS
jgi:low temperature requirement protein LtrA